MGRRELKMAARKYSLFYDLSEGILFDSEDNEIPASLLPYISTNESLEVTLQLCNSKSVTDTYNDLADTTITCSAVIDNNWDWFVPTVLGEQLVAGTDTRVTEINVIYSGTNYINPTGNLYLINGSGESEEVSYTAFEETSAGNYKFTINKIIWFSYNSGDTVNISEVPLCKAIDSDINKDNKATGKFIINISATSLRYLQEIQGSSEIKNCAFEFQIKEGDSLICKFEFDFKCYNVRDYCGVLPAASPGASILDGYVQRQTWTVENAPSVLPTTFNAATASPDDLYNIIAAILTQIKL